MNARLKVRNAVGAVVLPAALLASSSAATPRTYLVDPAASRVVVHVNRAGLFAFAGHTHEIDAAVADGAVAVDPDDLARSTVQLAFEASALRVSGSNEPAADVPEVQRTMDSDRVLDVSRFPRIAFRSRDIRLLSTGASHVRLKVTGDLTLHGVTRPATAEVSADVALDRLSATGTLTVKQTDFGIEPVSAGGGTVRVKDEVSVDFAFVARPASGRPLALHP